MSTPGFRAWIGNRELATVGTNAGSTRLAFQDWRNFKEAFAPELVGQAVSEHPIKVRSTIDPFGGSGTTALASRLLGIRPTTMEVNPYLADLIEAKLCTYDVADIGVTLATVLDSASKSRLSASTAFKGAPITFIEPGDGERWLFDRETAIDAARLRHAILDVESAEVRRLLLVLLGAVLVDSSNVIVSGKGRRYRQNWENTVRPRHELRERFIAAVARAVRDITRFAPYLTKDYRVVRGDSRSLLQEQGEHDLAVYSPPYPNSFDYTDVYNVELWMLGYLKTPADNRALRNATLSSHVQLLREFEAAPKGSKTLNRTMDGLHAVTGQLWNPHIPAMVGAYFAELTALTSSIASSLTRHGRQWLVVGDSKYAGVHVPVATILGELAKAAGLEVVRCEPFRSMRVAPQQGGRPELAETLLVLAS